MTETPAISVALPVRCAERTLRGAFASIASQTACELDILIVLNGSDDQTRAIARDLAAADPRARILELPDASLPAALNLALRESRHELVARMDADDLSDPTRLEVQANSISQRPNIAALGTAWRIAGDNGRIIAVNRPPTAATELRWRLLLENPLAHGSMMLRRSAVLQAGGYDERLARAQDYDLWLRLSASQSVACLPDVLYTHHLRDSTGGYSAGAHQAEHTAAMLTRAWAELPSLPTAARAELAAMLGTAMTHPSGRELASDELAHWLNGRGPSREALTGWLWAQWRLPAMSARATNAARRALIRECGSRLRAEGAERIWLWGAGAHTAWLLGHSNELGVEIAGLIDEPLAGQDRHGFTVVSQAAVPPGSHALLSSDAHEDSMWTESAPARNRGVRIWRLYGSQDATARA